MGRTAADRFPDGRLFADLRGTRADAGPAAALHTLLSGLGVPDQRIPAVIGVRSGLLRTVLAERHVRLVLDDAASEAQVRPLPPGSGGSRAPVTSRSRLSGLAGVHRLALDPLPEQDARTLLAAIAGRGRIAREPTRPLTSSPPAAGCLWPYASRRAGWPSPRPGAWRTCRRSCGTSALGCPCSRPGTTTSGRSSPAPTGI
ncbi:hypothetical protein [Streptomyces sp. NPDC017868]|uniref:hypothetical protein n=1 Tax=Streptomyces sp. NPDC017868 TaxID=3365014 RepID=UPI0037925340